MPIGEIIELIVTLVVAVIASSGLWAYIAQTSKKNEATAKLLLGVAHDRIIFLGSIYIRQGHITRDAYENLVDCLYTPYANLGGNGTAARIVEQVKKLEFHEDPPPG